MIKGGVLKQTHVTILFGRHGRKISKFRGTKVRNMAWLGFFSLGQQDCNCIQVKAKKGIDIDLYHYVSQHLPY